jgi:hypothetical protein
MALSRAHNVLTREKLSGANLREIVEGPRCPMRIQPGRFGSRRECPAQSSNSLGSGHGASGARDERGEIRALSRPAGSVEIAWSTSVDPPARLNLRWAEHGGPPVSPPRRRGFGSRLIERSLASDLGGEVNLAFEPEGVVCTVVAQLPEEVPVFIPVET